jgi:S1-C subfamily serine protease
MAKAQTEKKEDFYSQLCRGIIRLEHSEEIKEKSSNKITNITRPNGTAFFVRSGDDLFVVTARHVVEKEYDLHARVQCKNRITGDNEVILLKLKRDKWVFHPEDESIDTNYVDVAVMKISWIPDRGTKMFRYELPNTEEANKNQLPFEDPLPPDSILIFGFPLDIGFKLSEQKPLGRLGIVSMVTGNKFLKINNKFAEEKAMIIDAKMFPGNSGSPVINQLSLLQVEIKLLGLVIATNENLDFGIIEPVSRIRETIEIAKESPKNIDCWFLIN